MPKRDLKSSSRREVSCLICGKPWISPDPRYYRFCPRCKARQRKSYQPRIARIAFSNLPPSNA